MIKSDFHIHTSFSSDSNTPMENQVIKGINMGLLTICFTDHMDYDFPKELYGMDFLFSPDDYFKEIRFLKEKYKNKIDIRYGVELGLKRGISDKITSLTQNYKFDFIINSTHLVDNIDPYYPEYFDLYGTTKGLNLYYETILDNLSNCKDKEYDVVGHIDYLTRYTPEIKKENIPSSIIKKGDTSDRIKELTKKYYRENADIIDEILKKIISTGHGIEINTAGLKYGLGHPHPQLKILTRYKELGGEIVTVGSDAHETIHLGSYLKEAEKYLTQAGFNYYTIYKDRKPEFIKI